METYPALELGYAWRVLLSADWRFLGPTSYDNNSPNPAIANSEEGGYDAGHSRIPGFNYLDLTAVVHVTKGVDVRMGVTNLLDKDPPLLPAEITNEIQSNTFLAYDQLGRELFAAFTAKFYRTAMSVSPKVRQWITAALWGGLIAGALDILAASLITQNNVVRILQFIAGGVLGKPALDGGAGAAVLGFLLQEAMGVLIALIYVIGTSRWPGLLRRWIPAGIAYGVIVYFVMNYVVVPLSAWHSHPHFNAASFAKNMAAMLVFGLIVSFFARKQGAAVTV